MWFCMTCGEFLKDHPTNIQLHCFDHVCDDLNVKNVVQRMENAAAILKSAKSKVQKNSSKGKSHLIWKFLQHLFSKLSPFQKNGLFFLVLIGMLLLSLDRSLNNPYNSIQWPFLQTFGSLIELPDEYFY